MLAPLATIDRPRSRAGALDGHKVLGMYRILPIAFVLVAGTVACSTKDTYTLYRNSVTADSLRMHVATFNASETGDYNRGNCEQARELFQTQPGVRTRFWCEQGRYRR